MKIKRIIKRMGELLYPPRCPICDEAVLPWNKGICSVCLQKVRYVEEPRCCKCGKSLEEETAEYCKDCLERTHYFVKGRALYEYNTVAKSLYRLKYAGRQEYAEVFGEEMAYYLGDFLREIQPDALLPVPLHTAKERARGYNQSLLLARVLGEYLEIPVYENLVKRIKNTKPLKLLNPEERLNNLKKAFILAENGVKLNVIVIVDDIYTTGSTVDEITKVLQEGMGARVYFVTLAIGKTI